ncbi:MAG: hypothetical protein GXP38_07680, partial [Chloroflexi bacterium]|nr:hypothetical protein [Chloroflexota bacterium]
PTETPDPTGTPHPTETPEPTGTPTPRHDDNVEFIGVIDQIDPGQWIISGQTVTVDANTEIDQEKGEATVGALVKVKATRQADGSLYAREIKVLSPANTPTATPTAVPNRPSEFQGVINQIAENLWTIDSYQVRVDASTDIDEEHGRAEVGALVEVKAVHEEDGSLFAMRIKVQTSREDADETIEFGGFIQAMEANQWLINGITFQVDANTVIDEHEGPAVVGALVEGKALRQSDGSLYAYHIKVEGTSSPDPVKVEFEGQITAQTEITWTIGNREVVVDARTQLDEREGSLTLGAWAEVKALQQSDGSLWAEEIQSRKPENINQPEWTWEGVISSMMPMTWTVGSQVVFVNANTLIDTREGPAQVGATAEVTALQQNDGSLLATRIHIYNDIPDSTKVEFRGAITAISPTSWTIGGEVLTIDAGTKFSHLDQAELGALAEVKAQRQADGSYLALRIEIVGPTSNMAVNVEWSGLLNDFSATEWTVDHVSVQINDQTVIEGTPQVGATVEVHALMQGDGSLLATQLSVNNSAANVELKGTIESIGTTLWQIAGQTVMIDGRTAFDESNGPIMVGAQVEVHALLQADGSLVALRIKTED